ncbi:ring finger protein [Diplodia corticola]|uniref:RBR-type E3 ubiquitin transferase n=1 Tax=Diplodia corticola TaxID=236234 RepID=A0A1J9R8B5_9PEZI|nr:ring finger protein [Diplodia corticola]OJD36434.1 ring finger protein [Diplodia corticola]
MADSTDDEREEELSSIAAIFPELALDPANAFKASIDLTVAPSVPLAVTFPQAVDGALPKSLPTPPSSDNEEHAPPAPPKPPAHEIHCLSYLPPLRLQVTLPNGYPAHHPPQFDLSTSPKWLPDAALNKLIDEGPALWEEYGRGQIVFAYIDFLQQAAERCFDLVGDDGAVIEVAEDMKISLLDYDIKAKRERFEQETFDCGVCLEPKKGTVCHRLMRCGHVFCVACLQDFYTNCIREGDVSSVRCMDPSCGKEDRKKKKSERTVSPGELLQIPIEQDMVKRYVEMKRKKKLEADKDTVYCPRKWCQGPARSKKYPKITDLTQLVESDSEGEDESGTPPRDRVEEQMRGSKSGDRLAVCEDCEYAFCRVCLAGWHGEFVRCYPRSSTELTEEEQASYDYLRMHTSQCPTCSSPCQKTHGCNHMCCFQCRTHFCYLCGAWLAPDNPYQHFNNKNTGCYMRLWELEEGDEGNANNNNADRPVRFDGARGWEAAIAAANEADARDVQAAENAAAAAPGDQQNHAAPAALPLVPMPPRAANGPPLVVDVNQLPPLVVEMDRLRIAAVAQRGQHQYHPPRRAHPNQHNDNNNNNNNNNNANNQAAAAPRNHHHHRLPAGGPEANGAAGRHVRFRGNARVDGGQDQQQAVRHADDALQRFLAAAQADEEDDWDSDELDGDGDEAWVIPER